MTGTDVGTATTARGAHTDPAPDDRRARLAAALSARVARQRHPLSYPQQRLWFLDQLDPGSSVYIVPLIYKIRGPVDVALLSRAVTEVARRQQALRAVFTEFAGEPSQSVIPSEPIVLPLHDLRTVADPERLAQELTEQEARRPFPLESGPKVRGLVLRLDDQAHWLCLTLHHIVCDGWSLGVLGRELSECYRAFQNDESPDLPDLPVSYVDFAAWQLEQLAGASEHQALQFWRNKLAGLPELASLPTDFPRPPAQSHLGAHLDFVLAPELAAQVRALAHSTAATPFAVLLAAFCALVHAYTGSDEVITGSPIAGRTRVELQNLIGFFANTVVQRVDVTGNPSFRELVRRTRDEVRASAANQDYPFEKLVEELHPTRDPAHNPMFQLMFSYQEETDQPGGLRLPGCETVLCAGDTATAKFDLTLSVTSTPRQLTYRLEYCTDLFLQATARRLGEQFQTQLAASLADPDRRIGDIVLLSAEDAALVRFDADPAPNPMAGSRVDELFEAQVARTPDAPALLTANQEAGDALTYREVDARAEELAARLRALGVRPGVAVGVYLERTPELVVALLAVLKAGGGYLPLDPDYPADRIRFMVTDSGAPVLVTHGTLAHRIERLPATIVCVDRLEPVPAGSAPDAPGACTRASDRDLAYLIYTSGSTGKPKGVMVSHRNAVNFFAAMDPVLGEDDAGTWLAVTSMSFDISVLELLWTLTRGYRVVLRGDEPTAAAAGAVAIPAAVQARTMEFSLFYFGGDEGGSPQDKYRLMLDGARFADRNGFHAVWTPERHFHKFGGLYPNPSVTAASIAAVTERVAVRAGSVALPLHDPLRVAEEWSVVDNLSHGRAGLSVASGWQPNDFVLAPEAYADRKKLMMDQLEVLRRLWRGESVTRRNGVGADVEVRVFPPPIQPELPVWITSARSPETFQLAGEVGAGVLTHLLGLSFEQLAERVATYRQARRENGHAGDGCVTVMLHSFAGLDTDQVREVVREPLCAYIKSSLDLLAGLSQAMGREVDLRNLPESELDELVRHAFERFFQTSGLLGTPEHCADIVDQLKAIGVDEVACLVDFGVSHDQVLDALEHLATARQISEHRRRRAAADDPIPAQVVRHGVTHLQCTPSVAGVLAESRTALTGLQRLLVGGEALPDQLRDQLATLPAWGMHNMYGPTEATVWATTKRVEPDQPVTIGTPLAGVSAYVVDRYLRLLPPNVAGELVLGGESVAAGYHNRAALTAERFVPDPFSHTPGGRLYRTGDQARVRYDGELEFLGRLDHQVKLRGHRIECAEVENALRGHPSVRNAVVTVHGDGGDSRLVAYCVASAGYEAEFDASTVTRFLSRSLPEYMIPQQLVVLAEFPLTPNGKVDRARLPHPSHKPVSEYREPQSEREAAAAAVFADVLGVERVGIDDNFFESGGNSLRAVQLRTRLIPVVSPDLSLVDIFRFPTVRGLVAAFSDVDAGSSVIKDGARLGAQQRVAALARTARARGQRERQ